MNNTGSDAIEGWPRFCILQGMKLILAICCITILVSCQDKAFRKTVEGADQVTIYFYAPPTDSVARVVSTTDAKAIRRLVQLIDAPAADADCGADGRMVFFGMGRQLQEITFNRINDDCRHFYFKTEEGTKKTKMNAEAADLLESLALGRGF